MTVIAVFDHGKTNLKLSAIASDGAVLFSETTPTPYRLATPYRHTDLEAAEDWLLKSLRTAMADHRVQAVIATGHGSGGVLVDERGPVLPMLDYEETVPAAIDALYRRIMPPYEVAGSGILGGATHLARQLLWLESEWPKEVARARWFLPLPQYWAWRLSGVAAQELTSLGAQSHLWDARRGSFTAIVPERGWGRLMPPIRPAWERLGPLSPAVRQTVRTGDGGSDVQVLCGVHDSSANLYRWQRAGLGDFTLLSTGTWIVGLRAGLGHEALIESRSMTANLDVLGNVVAGVLTMSGRERAILAGDGDGSADPAAIARLIAEGTMALPSFVPFPGVFPGSAGQGRIVGPRPEGHEGQPSLAILYAALVADACLDLLRAEGTVILDGGLVADPVFAGLIAAFRPGQDVLVNEAGAGTTLGAALLWTHGEDSLIRAEPVRAEPLRIPGLDAYRNRWRRMAEDAGSDGR